MELKELRKKEEKDLHKLLAEFREKLRVLRFKDANKQLKNVRELREVRGTISHILTLLNNKSDRPAEVGEAKQAEAGEDKNI
jgi:ribosomal protein L29